MKPRDVAELLTAYANALSSVGGRPQAEVLAQLAQALTKGPGATIAAVIKRWNGLSLEAKGSPPTLGDTARLIRPLSGIIEVGGKAGASTDLFAIHAFLEERSTVPLALLVERAGGTATKARAAKSAAPVRQALVDDHVRRLHDAIGDGPRFKLAFDALSDLSLPELVAVAKILTAASPRTRDAANKKIWALHQSVSDFDAKVRATGGRSAA